MLTALYDAQHHLQIIHLDNCYSPYQSISALLALMTTVKIFAALSLSYWMTRPLDFTTISEVLPSTSRNARHYPLAMLAKPIYGVNVP
jgi:hypothetical protein